MNFNRFSIDVLGNIIKSIEQEDIFNLAKTNKKLYKAVLLHYNFDDYKLLLKLSDADFNIVLKNVNIDPEVVFKAIISGNKYQLLKKYLNKIDPSLDNNWAIRKASENGYTSVVKLLLDLPIERGVDPSVDNNWAIESASINGFYEIVKLLSELGLERGVNPSSDNNFTIKHTSANGYTSVVKLLLDLPLERGVDPSD